MMEPILRIGVCRRYLLRAERHKMINPLVHQESHLIKIVSTRMMTMMTKDIKIYHKDFQHLVSTLWPSHPTQLVGDHLTVERKLNTKENY